MRRREFIVGLGGAAAWPVVARAQQAMPVIGYLSNLSVGDRPIIVKAFHEGLSMVGYAEGRNVAVEYRWAGGVNQRLPALANELVHLSVALIVASGDTAALAAKAATTKIPIVYSGANDPVKLGLVTSLNRPGGNLTGVANLNIELGPKRLEVVRELLPNAVRIALLINQTSANATLVTQSTQMAANKVGIDLTILHASTDHELDVAFQSLVEQRFAAVIIGADIFFNSRSPYLAALTVRHALPSIFQTREFAAAGGLISFGGAVRDAYREVGVYAGRILKGESPAELPVQQLSKFEMIINLKTARTLGLTVPQTLLARADEIIE